MKILSIISLSLLMIIWSCGHPHKNKYSEHSVLEDFQFSDTIIYKIDSFLNVDNNSIYAMYISKFRNGVNVFVYSVYDRGFLAKNGYPFFYYTRNRKLLLIYCGIEDMLSKNSVKKDLERQFYEMCSKNNIKEVDSNSGRLYHSSILSFKIKNNKLSGELNVGEFGFFMNGESNIDSPSKKYVPIKIIKDSSERKKAVSQNACKLKNEG